jgi:hypothetical protein
VCYFLYIASPLTLSEVRSMLPRGLTADLASYADQQILKSIHPQAMTVARILSGRCSCDLVRTRLTDSKDDERHLRERYRRLELPRSATIAALERHRTGVVRAPHEGWAVALSRFVVEHARNAGPTLYLLQFQSGDSTVHPRVDPLMRSPGEVHQNPEKWLVEATPVLVG